MLGQEAVIEGDDDALVRESLKADGPANLAVDWRTQAGREDPFSCAEAGFDSHRGVLTGRCDVEWLPVRCAILKPGDTELIGIAGNHLADT